MKILVSLALALALTASFLVGCGCTNQNMDNTSAPTVLPTNEEIWNSTESTTRSTTESTIRTEPTETTAGTETTDASRSINETQVQNHVNAHTDMMDKIRDNEKIGGSTEGNASRMIPGRR